MYVLYIGVIFLCYFKKREKNIKLRVIFVSLFVVFLLLYFVLWVNKKLDPLVCDIAEEQIKNNIADVVSNTVSRYISDGEYINITYDNGVRTVCADQSALNLLKANVISDISSMLESAEEYSVKVSLSNLFDDEVIFGRFPSLNIPASILPIYSVNGNIRTELTSAGINQSHYNIVLSINVDVNALLLISTIEISTNYDMCIADVVIVGEVPSVYLSGE